MTLAELSFPPLTGPLGLYPVVPDAQWVHQLLRWGVRTVQLRAKPEHYSAPALAREVQAAVEAARAYPDAQLFINDHWELALAHGAYGVHLGQGDWAGVGAAARARLRSSGLRLGLSTHTPEELQLACKVLPSYVAIGPVYPTTLKVMPYAPVGLTQLRDWCALAAPCPVVAIGGISLERMAGVMHTGVDGIAVVSAITQAADPQDATTAALALTRRD